MRTTTNNPLRGGQLARSGAHRDAPKRPGQAVRTERRNVTEAPTMTLEEKREIAAILKTMGVVMHGRDKADEGPNTLEDLQNIHAYLPRTSRGDRHLARGGLK
jgi:hypothetical protein